MSFSSDRHPNADVNRYRSWGEAQIGRMLDRYGIPFLHEHPLAVVDDGRTRIWYPDFQLPSYGVILEYVGRLHDPDYAERTAHKRAVFEANGSEALMFTPDVFGVNWPARILGQIENVLTERVARFQAMISENAHRK